MGQTRSPSTQNQHSGSIFPRGHELREHTAMAEVFIFQRTADAIGGKFSMATAISMTSPWIQMMPMYFTPRALNPRRGDRMIAESIGPGSRASILSGHIG